MWKTTREALTVAIKVGEKSSSKSGVATKRVACKKMGKISHARARRTGGDSFYERVAARARPVGTAARMVRQYRERQ